MFAWKSLTKTKGKAYIYQDVLVMGSVYVIKSIFYYIKGPHNQYVLVDMSLTFIFRRGLPGKCLGKRPRITTLHPTRKRVGWGFGFGAFV